jgi:endonuclease/exonuclease/phosphatase family metal-dependent hydrolase
MLTNPCGTSLLACQLALCICLSGGLSTVKAEESLRIVTWNAREVFSPSEVSARRDDFRKFAKALTPDILLLQEVNSHAVAERIREVMGLDGFYVYCSNFETSDAPSHNAFEVAIISRLPAFQVIEFDPTPDNSDDEHDSEESPMPKLIKLGLQDVSTSRGLLWAHYPKVRLTIANVHLKSSGGASGGSDHSNAAKRELVAAAVADCVNDDLEFFPNYAHLVAGDFNVGHSDSTKNGHDIANDTTDGYDDTHALLGGGIVGSLRMRNLIGHISTPTYPDFPGTPIDNIYVVGSLASGMQHGEIISDTFGSDHRPVRAIYKAPQVENVDSLAAASQLEEFPNLGERAHLHQIKDVLGSQQPIAASQRPLADASHTPSEQSQIEILKSQVRELSATLERLETLSSGSDAYDGRLTPLGPGGNSFGRFDGRVLASWSNDGRSMTLEDDFHYIDSRNRRWSAPRGSVVDGASIPRPFWTIVGGPFEGQYRNASVVHDVHCDRREHPWRDVHRMFYEACRCGGAGKAKAKVMYYAIFHFGPRWNAQGEVLKGASAVTLSEGQLAALQAYVRWKDPSLDELAGMPPEVFSELK